MCFMFDKSFLSYFFKNLYIEIIKYLHFIRILKIIISNYYSYTITMVKFKIILDPK